MSSSPNLPSPSQLFSDKSMQMSSGNRAIPIPKDAAATFASVSSLLRQARFEGEEASESTPRRLDLENVYHGAEKNPTKAHIDGSEVGKTSGEVPSFKKPKTPLVEKSTSARQASECARLHHVSSDAKTAEHLAPKKVRRKRSKEESEAQTKINKAKVTKPGTSKIHVKSIKSAAGKEQAKAKSLETFNTLLPSQEEDTRAKQEFRDLCLDKAIPLRRQWTPCKDTVRSDIAENAMKSPSSNISEDHPRETAQPVPGFGQLLGDFGFAKEDDVPVLRPVGSRHDTGESVLKRRKIDIVQGVPTPPHTEKPKRIKSPKKKPQTITGKATAAFVSADATATPTLLQYFDGRAKSTETPLPCEADQTTVPINDGRKLPLKKAPKVKSAKSKAITRVQPIILSPESAVKDAGNQDIIFGTSSQLAREESPTTIKDLQQAIEESTTMSQELGTSILPGGRFRTSNPLVPAHPRNLWTSASRDLEGMLLKAETVDLSETPEAPKQQSKLATSSAVTDLIRLELRQEGEVDNPSVRNDVEQARKLNLEPTPLLQHVQEPSLVIPRSVAEATLRKRATNRSPVKNAVNNKADPNQMPNYQGFTDAQLSKEVAAYGFKAIKKRVAMITLLEKCWESKVSMAHQEVHANLTSHQAAPLSADTEMPRHNSPGKNRRRRPKSAVMSTAAVDIVGDVPAKKPRGRPRKDVTASTPPPKRKRKSKTKDKAQSQNATVVADEIYDSSPPTPSPPRLRSSQSPRQLQLTQSTKVSKMRAAKEDRTLLLEQITKAVTTFPPTHDPKNMTFYEKILMFEPIVLEDLAAWLNTQGLSRVGEDDEVWPGLVKEWCETRSVCCLWKENLSGGNRGRW